MNSAGNECEATKYPARKKKKKCGRLEGKQVEELLHTLAMGSSGGLNTPGL